MEKRKTIDTITKKEANELVKKRKGRIINGKINNYLISNEDLYKMKNNVYYRIVPKKERYCWKQNGIYKYNIKHEKSNRKRSYP